MLPVTLQSTVTGSDRHPDSYRPADILNQSTASGVMFYMKGNLIS